jgi:hypothetical protein
MMQKRAYKARLKDQQYVELKELQQQQQWSTA